jgi:hypothetical protein
MLGPHSFLRVNSRTRRGRVKARSPLRGALRAALTRSLMPRCVSPSIKAMSPHRPGRARDKIEWFHYIYW